MKKAYFLSLFIVLLLLNACKIKGEDSKEEILKTTQNKYLGQTPPGKTADETFKLKNKQYPCLIQSIKS